MRTFDGIPITNLEYVLGRDKRYAIHVYTNADMHTSQDVTGYDTHFMVKRRLSDPDVNAILSIDGSVSGTFNVSPSLNAQRVYVLLDDEATDTEIPPGDYQWEVMRQDAGAEVTLAFGVFTAKRLAHIA